MWTLCAFTLRQPEMVGLSHGTVETNVSANIDEGVSQRRRMPDRLARSPVNIQMDPPQIATEGFSSDSLSERSPEQHTKNVEKSRRANIIFSAKSNMAVKKRNFAYYSVILNTKM